MMVPTTTFNRHIYWALALLLLVKLPNFGEARSLVISRIDKDPNDHAASNYDHAENVTHLLRGSGHDVSKATKEESSSLAIQHQEKEDEKGFVSIRRSRYCLRHPLRCITWSSKKYKIIIDASKYLCIESSDNKLCGGCDAAKKIGGVQYLTVHIKKTPGIKVCTFITFEKKTRTFFEVLFTFEWQESKNEYRILATVNLDDLKVTNRSCPRKPKQQCEEYEDHGEGDRDVQKYEDHGADDHDVRNLEIEDIWRTLFDYTTGLIRRKTKSAVRSYIGSYHNPGNKPLRINTDHFVEIQVIRQAFVDICFMVFPQDQYFMDASKYLIDVVRKSAKELRHYLETNTDNFCDIPEGENGFKRNVYNSKAAKCIYCYGPRSNAWMESYYNFMKIPYYQWCDTLQSKPWLANVDTIVSKRYVMINSIADMFVNQILMLMESGRLMFK